MYFKLLMLACTLLANTTHTMDIKVVAPTETDIDDKTTLITFRKETMSVCHWIGQAKTRTFGNTRIFELLDKNGLKQTSTVRTMTDDEINDFDTIACVYVDKLEKIYTSNNKHTWIGAFLFYNFNYLPKKTTKIELLQNYYRSNIPVNKRPSKELLVDSKKTSTPARSKDNIKTKTSS